MQLQCLQPSPSMVCSHHHGSAQSHSQDCVGTKKRCWYLPWPSEKSVVKEMKYQQEEKSLFASDDKTSKVIWSGEQICFFCSWWYFRWHQEAVFTTPEMLFLVCDYRQHLQGYEILLSHLSFCTTHFYTTKSVCMTAKWLHRLQYAASHVPESWHVLQSLLGMKCSCTLLLFENIYWRAPKQGISVFPLLVLAIAHILRILQLRPPGNPLETHPLLSRLAQETVVVKRQKPSQKWQINSSI